MSNTETIVLGGGCFWCTESVFKEVRGVLDVESGYSNGQETAPTYEQVCTGRTGCTGRDHRRQPARPAEIAEPAEYRHRS